MIVCKECGSLKVENRDTQLCGSCSALARRANRTKASDNNSPINKKSEKQSYWDRKYLNRLKTWKRGKKCAATFPHDCQPGIECHHMYGRSVNAYHDEWARENEIPELMDERFWMPLCEDAHRYVTEHSKFAWANGYSFKRVSDPIFRTSKDQTI